MKLYEVHITVETDDATWTDRDIEAYLDKIEEAAEDPSTSWSRSSAASTHHRASGPRSTGTSNRQEQGAAGCTLNTPPPAPQ